MSSKVMSLKGRINNYAKSNSMKHVKSQHVLNGETYSGKFGRAEFVWKYMKFRS